jgi:hypothetical protein
VVKEYLCIYLLPNLFNIHFIIILDLILLSCNDLKSRIEPVLPLFTIYLMFKSPIHLLAFLGLA